MNFRYRVSAAPSENEDASLQALDLVDVEADVRDPVADVEVVQAVGIVEGALRQHGDDVKRVALVLQERTARMAPAWVPRRCAFADGDRAGPPARRD